MGFQLWTSRVTGYRRRGTRLEELMSVLGGGAVTQTILEPLQSVPIDGPASEFKRILDERGFDVAGVKQSEDGPVLGFVVKEELQSGCIGDYLKPINAEDLISEATQMLALTRKRSFLITCRPGLDGLA